ncbi:MAG: GNAT family N-acetyltransferase [Anaeromicrobium sp.]|jgi:hypothetical protein|uniref:GNAT family N-acetyltransferase n=1 Tax=Anaeromicrobium sp. TaxID=1929132 RepID=UPI0025F26C7C|nr:GNAT family N-acetyltransferase [Anaeromicrobium sp.]MCT4594248.1 GNAT family N-acetyltransferase [Anaeromicrobium sp.]
MKTYDTIDELEHVWDEKFKIDSISSFESLKNLEKNNPCFQRYHVDFNTNTFIIDYKLNINVFTFKGPFNLKFPLNIIGMPFSISKKGYSFSNMEKYIKSTKGFKLILNSNDNLDLPRGHTLPSCVLDINFKSFNDYLNSMRSSYRYRLKKALCKGTPIQIEEIENYAFNQELYNLYLQVYMDSKEKLEKLSMDFFKTYPSKIFVFKLMEKKVAFVQLVSNKDELIFLFGGFNKKMNLEYDIYLNMLLFMIKHGIENNFKSIDFGQTAEESKLKVGCVYKEKYMYFHHHNKLINKVLYKIMPYFSYKPYSISHKVFKE